jgi:hypothetical protein
MGWLSSYVGTRFDSTSLIRCILSRSRSLSPWGHEVMWPGGSKEAHKQSVHGSISLYATVIWAELPLRVLLPGLHLWPANTWTCGLLSGELQEKCDAVSPGTSLPTFRRNVLCFRTQKYVNEVTSKRQNSEDNFFCLCAD